VVQLAAQHKLPALYPYRAVVDAGGLMAYEAAMPDLLARTAAYVDRILKGARPASQVSKFLVGVTGRVVGIDLERNHD